MPTESTRVPSPAASGSLALFQMVELLVESLQVHFGHYIIIELPEMNLAYLRLARRARELAQFYPEVLEALEAFLGTFPSLYGIGDWLDIWNDVWEVQGENYQKVSNLRNAAAMLFVANESSSESVLQATDDELLKKSSEAIQNHRLRKAREYARMFGPKTQPEASSRPPTSDQTATEPPSPPEADAAQEKPLSSAQQVAVLENLISRLLTLISIHFSGYLLMEYEGANIIYLRLKKWAEQLVTDYSALQEALEQFLGSYPNLYEAGDDVDWEYSDWCVAPLKARLSEAVAEAGAIGVRLPSKWSEALASADKVIEAFQQSKRKSDALFLRRARAGAAKQAAMDRQFVRGTSEPIVRLPLQQEAEFQQHQYKSRLPILVSGAIPARQTNVAQIGSVDVPLSDETFALLLRLIVALKENPEGYVFKGDRIRGGGLVTEGFLNADGIDQGILRLRQAVRPALESLPYTDFIEGRLAKHIRLSTHSALITIQPRLLNHPNDLIKGLARKLIESSDSTDGGATKPDQAAE